MKPPKHLRVKFATDYHDQSAFASKARLLQGILRTEKGYELEEKGKVKGKNRSTDKIVVVRYFRNTTQIKVQF